VPLLFSYGSLQEESVQLSTFGRRLDGQRDEIVGAEPALVTIDDPQEIARSGRSHHANLVLNGKADCRVPGIVFDVTEEELASVDAYEAGFSYLRAEAALASGKRAWVYIHDGTSG
jgi:hypothetical protein